MVSESVNEHLHLTKNNHGMAPHVKEAIDSMRVKYRPLTILNKLKPEERPSLSQIYNYLSNRKN
jgi:hypothetical protein